MHNDYGLSSELAWRMVPGWAQRELELRYDGPIPVRAMVDAMSWPQPPERSKIDEELHWIEVDREAVSRAARNHIRLAREGDVYRDDYLRRLSTIRHMHSELMARRGFLLRIKNGDSATSIAGR